MVAGDCFRKSSIVNGSLEFLGPDNNFEALKHKRPISNIKYQIAFRQTSNLKLLLRSNISPHEVSNNYPFLLETLLDPLAFTSRITPWPR